MSEDQRNSIIRFAIIFIFVLLGFVAVVCRIFKLQHIEQDQWLTIAQKQEPVLVPIQANRGNILDCNGSILASSMPQYKVFMDTKTEALRKANGALFYEHLDTLAQTLSAITQEHTTSDYKALLRIGYQSNDRRLSLSLKNLNYIQKRQLDELPLLKKGKYKSGIYYEPQYKRVKPFRNLASRTIGSIYGDGGYGNVGIEMAFETELKGEDGLASKQRIGGRMEYITMKEATDGHDVRTTIDITLQDIVEKALLNKLERLQAQWGCCILIETHTGAIKAIANLDKASDGKYYELQNHAVNRVEPGSTFKPIAMMVAIDDGKIDIDDKVEITKKPWNYLSVSHTDAHKMDTTLTVRSAIAVSSNIAMAKIITQAYEGSAKKFVNRIARTGLMDSVYCEIPGAQKIRIDVPNDTVTLSKMSYGYSVELSPMQIAMFYNAIANDGKMMRPMLVQSIERNGEIIDSFEPEVVKSSICSSSTLCDIQSALEDVVWDNHLGTASVNAWGGRKAQSDLVEIAGKTGTAQIFDGGRYHSNRHRITFVGYFPMEQPQYTCICMINDPKPYYDSGADCGWVVRTIAEQTMAQTGGYQIDNQGNKQLIMHYR